MNICYKFKNKEKDIIFLKKFFKNYFLQENSEQ